MTALDIVPINWSTRVEDVPARGLVWQATATAKECSAIAAALELRTLTSLKAEGRIEAVAGGRYRLKARIRAEIVQACVISLDDVAGRFDEALNIEFRPADQIDKSLAQAPDLEEEFDPEPIVDGQLETGRVVFEHLAAGIDPYPRSAGAGLPDVIATHGGAEPRINPFAALAQLKVKAKDKS